MHKGSCRAMQSHKEPGQLGYPIQRDYPYDAYRGTQSTQVLALQYRATLH